MTYKLITGRVGIDRTSHLKSWDVVTHSSFVASDIGDSGDFIILDEDAHWIHVGPAFLESYEDGHGGLEGSGEKRLIGIGELKRYARVQIR